MAMTHAAPRCKARCKYSKAPCRSAAVSGRSVCRMHGGKADAPKGERNGAYRHGRHTCEAKAAPPESSASSRTTGIPAQYAGTRPCFAGSLK
jgi:hypothetical protein